jgi:hypothetical protein
LVEWNSVRAAYVVTGRQTLHETLLGRLRQMIQDGELASAYLARRCGRP